MRTIGVIQKRSSITAAWSAKPRSLGSVAARHHAEVSATKGSSPRSSCSASTRLLLRVAGQLLNPLKRFVVEPVGAGQALGEQLQALSALPIA